MFSGDYNNIEEVALYLNKELLRGRVQSDIEINDFKVKKGTISKRLNRKGYKKIEGQFVGYDNNNTIVTDNKNSEYDNSNTIVVIDNDNSDTQVINEVNINKEKILGLVSNYDKIIKLIEEYDKKCVKEYDNIEIELPIETIKDFRTSIRVNNIIWEQFNEFTNNHKEFTKRDLLSMALKEYIENHK